MNKNNLLFLGISLIVAAICLGGLLYKGIRTFTDKDRIVTVKGLAEMDMEATSAKIIFTIARSGNNPKTLITPLDNQVQKIANLLVANDLKTTDIEISTMETRDKGYDHTYDWNGSKRVKVAIDDRYTVVKRISINCTDVKEAENISAELELMLIENNIFETAWIDYEFPALNTIKPQLIAESTKNARVAGEQFAKDSQAKLGRIKTASQGQITINDNNNYYYDESGYENSVAEEPYLQRARVVSTIVFFLE